MINSSMLKEAKIFNEKKTASSINDVGKTGQLICKRNKTELSDTIYKNKLQSVENSMEVPQKIKNSTTIDPEFHFRRFFLKSTKMLIQKKCMHPCIHFSIIYNSQDMEAI